LEQKVPILDFDLGFPPQPIPTIGALHPDRLHIELVSIEVENPEDLYYRAIGRYSATIETYGGA
jgi:hypothetical protein